jgi:hypothetical protein
MDSAYAEIVERLARGETPEAVLSSLRPDGMRAALQACAVVRVFDRPTYEALLAPSVTTGDAPGFDELVTAPEVEPVPRTEGSYRLGRSVRSAHWRAWWQDEPGRPETQLPPALRALVERLVEHYRSTDQPLDLLAQLSLSRPMEAAALFTQLYREADERVDLAACQDLVDVLSDEDRNPLLPPALTELRNDRATYLKARSLWSTEYLQTGSFLEPEGTRAAYERLIAGPGPRVLQLHAPGGRGKTMELRWLISRQLVPERPDVTGPLSVRIPCAKIDFDSVDPVNTTKTPWLVLLAAAAQLNQQLPHVPFAQFLEEHGWAVPLLPRDVADPERAAAASRRLTSQHARLTTSVPKAFARGLAEAGPMPVLLVLDTLEEVHLRPHGDLRALLELLRRTLDECPTLRLVLSGRHEIRSILGPAAAALLEMAERTPEFFSPASSERYLDGLRGIDRPEVRAAIAAKAGGDPFKLSLLADLAEQRPRISPAEIDQYEADLIYLVLRVVNRIEDPAIRWLLRYGVVPRTLTVEFVRDVMQPYLRAAMAGELDLDAPDADALPAEVADDATIFPTDLLSSPDAELDLGALWEQLRRYVSRTSWVSAAPDEPTAVRFHPVVLVPMRRVLRSQPVFRHLHERAAAHYAEKARIDREHWDRWMREAVYHRFQLDGAAASPYWREALDQVEIGEPERREALAAELLEPDYVDAEGRPHDVDGSGPVVAPETVIDAHFARASALAQMARTARVSPDDQLWSRAEENLAAVEHGHRELGRQVVPEWRLAYVRAALALKDGRPESAQQQLTAALAAAPTDASEAGGDLQDLIRLRLLLADAQLARGDHAALATFRSAVRSAGGLASAARWEPPIRRRLVAALAELDWLREADAELQDLLAAGPVDAGQADAEHWTELQLLHTDIALRSGQVARAEENALRTVDSTADYRATTALVQAALAGRQVRRALDLATAAAIPADGEAAATAAGLELAGLSAGELMQFERASALLEQARSAWFGRGELECVARCYTRSAVLQMRGSGHLTLAEHHLYEADKLEVAVGSESWVERASARAELLDRQGRSADAVREVRSTLDQLRGRWTPPRRLVRTAVAALAVCGPEQRTELLDLIIDQLRLVSPPSARVVLLDELDRVRDLSDEASARRLDGIRGLLLGDDDPRLTAGDRALLALTLVELDRLTGQHAAARTALAALRPGLVTGIVHRDWWSALDRLHLPTDTAAPTAGEPAGYAAFAGFVEEFRDLPMLCAAFLVERAEAQRDGDDALTERLVHEAAGHLSTVPEQGTQWHARLQQLEGELARRRSAERAAASALSAAGSAFTALGDERRATVAPTARDRALVGLEGSRTRVQLTLDDDGLQVLTAPPADTGAVHRHGRGLPLVGALLGEGSSHSGQERFSAELVELIRMDWTAVARDLGQLMFPEPEGVGVVPPSDLRVEVGDRALGGVPWELALHPRTGTPLAVAYRTVYRAVSRVAAARDEILFVQSALNRAHGSDLVTDGDFGPLTGGVLRSYQARRGLENDGVVREAVLDALQADLAPRDRRPLVVLAQPSSARQLQGLRGKASHGLDLHRLYERSGFDVVTVEDPTPARLAAALTSAVQLGGTPALLHLSGSLRESGGGVAFTFLAGEWESEVWDGSRSHELPVTVVRQLLAELPRGGGPRPVVVLDVDRPSGATDTVVHLLLRNTFAAELFALGECAAVLATGLVSDTGYELYEQLSGLLGAGRSIGETTGVVHHMGLDPRERDLERVLPFAGAALFTHLPWLCLAPAPGGPGADR